MSLPKITVVAGCAGAGKTTWIHRQILIADPSENNILYFAPGTGNVPIDQTHLQSEFTNLKIFSDGQEIEFISHLIKADRVFIEIAAYLELGAIASLLDSLPYHRVAVLPPSWKDSEFHPWAKEIIPGAAVQTTDSQNQLWRSPTTGQVIDEDSLQEFWYELTQGAYGEVTRAKGVFTVADGRSLYADFVQGVPSTDFFELDFPRHLEGRPQLFSGIEVLGSNLDQVVMRQTLGDCCLADNAILQYQQQVKQILAEEAIS
ncbi:CobW C-terminal domain-containing protein [Calothrix sp. 336/3]|uniref:GTP-binding protein n=1 Tax=Calothrix sp. 336/3 TaxID=1337936 RepID=UPI0004E41126|nr:GTP-binding protein [Calothrix sp. 336/3]AKG24041.1 GTPase, G3E family protein [Calothrix sp. 336/3]